MIYLFCQRFFTVQQKPEKREFQQILTCFMKLSGPGGIVHFPVLVLIFQDLGLSAWYRDETIL